MPAEHRETLTFDINPNDWPLTEPVVRRGEVATLLSQVDFEWGDDADFVAKLCLDSCAYGAAICPVYPFVCQLLYAENPPTGRDILRAVKARHFQSEHIASLDRSYIPFPGYHAGTKNDEVHNDFQEQYVILFVLGKSPHGDRCVGVVTHQVCHNLCD